jgi:hypothetical protein
MKFFDPRKRAAYERYRRMHNQLRGEHSRRGDSYRCGWFGGDYDGDKPAFRAGRDNREEFDKRALCDECKAKKNVPLCTMKGGALVCRCGNWTELE